MGKAVSIGLRKGMYSSYTAYTSWNFLDLRAKEMLHEHQTRGRLKKQQCHAQTNYNIQSSIQSYNQRNQKAADISILAQNKEVPVVTSLLQCG